MTLGVSLKLYLDVAATTLWAQALADIAQRHSGVLEGSIRLFVLPSLPAFPAVQRALAGVPIAVGAQDLHWEDRGAFTGGVSGSDLREIGCELVEIGHAERLSVWGEGREIARAKLQAALRNGLTPLLCVGEASDGTPEAAAADCIAQLDDLLDGSQAPNQIMIAYEPVWAIGAAQTACAEHILGVATRLRAHLDRVLDSASVTLIYGGSAQPGTMSAIGQAVDGLFLGRFAHDPSALEQIVLEAEALLHHNQEPNP